MLHMGLIARMIEIELMAAEQVTDAPKYNQIIRRFERKKDEIRYPSLHQQPSKNDPISN